MRNYRDLQVWSKAHNLTLGVVSNLSGISARRNLRNHQPVATAAASIGANLAEGCGRRTSTELARFVRIAWARPVSLIITSCSRGTLGL